MTAFKGSLELHGARVVRVVLFGARVRGEARRDSDYDDALFLDDYADRWLKSDRVADAGVEVLSNSGAFIHAMPCRADHYDEPSSLMHEIRRDGRVI